MQEQAMEQETDTPPPIHGTERMMGESPGIDCICSANKIDEIVTVVLWLQEKWTGAFGRGTQGQLWRERAVGQRGFPRRRGCPDTHLSSPPVMKLDLAEP